MHVMVHRNLTVVSQVYAVVELVISVLRGVLPHDRRKMNDPLQLSRLVKPEFKLEQDYVILSATPYAQNRHFLSFVEILTTENCRHLSWCSKAQS